MTNGKIDIAASRKKHEPSLSGRFFFLALELASRRACLSVNRRMSSAVRS
jgi:hypothetical protein